MYLLKFLKYLFAVFFVYAVLYIVYSVVILATQVELYFVVLATILLLFAYWFIAGMLWPKLMPFLKLKKRFWVFIFGILFLLAAGGLVFCVETYIFKRDPIEATKNNALHLFNGVKQIHPLESQELKELHKERKKKASK